jgi:hypothetical protein
MRIPKVCLLTFIILILAVFALSNQAPKTGAEPSEDTADPLDNSQTTITPRQAWALACAAVLNERNHARHDLLGTEYRTQKNIKDGKRFLVVSGWGVKNQADLLDSLTWIDNGGHRKNFKWLGQRVQALTHEEYRKLLDGLQTDDERLNKIKVAAQYYEALGDKGLFGWDYSRYICLCRWGYMAGYLSEEQAWKKIMPVAKLIQSKFDSWQDLGQNYLIGRQFWSYEDTKLWGYLYEDAFLRLLDMPSSPWNKLPWDMDLTEKKPASDPNKTDTVEKTQLILTSHVYR